MKALISKFDNFGCPPAVEKEGVFKVNERAIPLRPVTEWHVV